MKKLRKILYFTTALWLTMSIPAEAGPLVGALATFVGGITAAQVATTVGMAVLNFGFQTLVGALFGPKAPKQKGVKQEMEFGGDKAPTFIMGTYGTPGHLLYQNSFFGLNNLLVQVILLSCLPVSGVLNKIDVCGDVDFIDKTTTDADGFNPVLGYQKNGKEYLKVKFHAGGQTTADPFLVDTFGDDPDWAWTNDMICKGCAYMIVQCLHSIKGVWPGNPTFMWTVQGIPVYDQRKDSTAGGSGPHRLNDRSTWTFSENLKVLENNVHRGIPDIDGSHLWGGRAEPYRLPADYWFPAMNTCDENIEKKNGDIINRYAGGIEISLDEQPLDIVRAFNAGCNGDTWFHAGQYKTVCGPPGLSLLTISDKDFMITDKRVDDQFTTVKDTFNSAIATYPEPGSGWSMEAGPLYIDADYLEADGDDLQTLDVQLRCVREANQAQRVMRAALKDHRSMLIHQGVLPPEYFILEPHDRFTYQSVDNGYHGDGIDFLIESKESRYNVQQAVIIRSLNPDAHYWVKEMELDQTVGKPGRIRAGSLDLAFSIAAGQIDSPTGGKDRPAINVSWTWGAIDIDVRNVLWRVRKAGTTKIIKDGTIHRLKDGDYQISGNFLRFGKSYEVQFEPVPISKRDSTATAWQSVTCLLVDVPAAPALTIVSKLAADGKLVYYLDVEWLGVSGEATYRIRDVVDGKTDKINAGDALYKRISVSTGEVHTVTVAAIVDGEVGDYSPASGPITITKKSANNDPATGLTATINRQGKIIVKATRNTAQKDFKRFRLYSAPSNNFALASFVDDFAGSRFEHGDLGNAVDQYYWVTTEDQSDNESPKFPVSNLAGIKGSTIRLVADDYSAGSVTARRRQQPAERGRECAGPGRLNR
jgi:hypothetical protein